MFYLLSFKGCGLLLLFFRRRTHLARATSWYLSTACCRFVGRECVFGVVQLGVVMFCFSKYFLHYRFFFLSFFSIQLLLFFTALERSLVGYWAISQHGPSGLRHSATFPNFDGLINWSSNDIGMRSMEVWNWEHKISNNLLTTSHNCFFKFSFLGL